ncbi:hypothetical protein BDY19DRAFT_994406 [Irpex rosettiformis]|uniref:Uncharacterized protein n=1 Tax=Irpex rosettiformis TaxID=378272 RepID=A0ACB8U0V0_9APHY|nr:hypothetical protein BDY19DRAFT_994406 [Irpex rosettiformis]
MVGATDRGPTTCKAWLLRPPSPLRPSHSFHPGFFISATISTVAGAAIIVSSWSAAALRAEGTVLLKESLDVDTLGAYDISNPSIPSLTPFSSPSSPAPTTPHIDFQPATPTFVSSTPSPSGRTATAVLDSLAPTRSSTSSSSDREVYYDPPEDSDLQTKRRSMYRSPGTASSPDLATLLRKSRREAGSRERSRDGRAVVTPGSATQLTPNRLVSKDNAINRSSRQRSSTSSSNASPSSSSGNMTPSRNKQKAPPVPSLNVGHTSSPDWGLTSPRSMSSMRDSIGSSKSGMSSVRAKTTAFLGRVKDTFTTRERSGTVTSSSPASPTYFEAPPPVPPLPNQDRQEATQSPESDVFSTPLTSPNFQKPLPEILNDDSDTEIEDFDDRSMVLVHPRARTPSPTATVTHSDPAATIAPKRNKRRSMSVSDVDLKRVMAAASSSTPLPRTSGHASKDSASSDWNTSLTGIITDFKGELMQLDPISASFDLRDPSTPARRKSASARANSEELTTSIIHDRPLVKHGSSVPVIKTINTSSTESSPTQRDALSPESPVRTPSISSSISQHRPTGLRYGPRSPGTRSTLMTSPIRDNNRLQVQHRSTASSSEPSLLPAREGLRSFSGLSAFSQQDLSGSDLMNRFSTSRSPSGRSEEPGDLLTRGKELATRCWEEDEGFMAKDKFAEWLGGQSPINKVALRHYVDFFDFSSLRLDNAFRKLCAKLYLKAETQQVDRILEQFARRYWECNPSCLFGSANVVHAVAYSLLLLNTDLHVAELTSRMTRSQFVHNTIAAIQTQVQPGSSSDLAGDDWSSVRAGSDVSDMASNMRTIKRSDSMTSWSSVTREAFVSNLKAPSSGQLTTGSTDTSSNTQPQTPLTDSALSVASSTREPKSSDNSAVTPMVYDRNWEAEMETMLKDIYTSVKTQQILQPIGSIALARSSTSSLSPHGTVLRSRSMRTASQDRLNNFKRGSIRGIQSILTPQLGYSPYGMDGRASPAPSFATSNEGVNASTTAFLTPALGFASNLSHTIIRETQEDDARSVHSDNSISTDVSISDEELALLGPPWAKEGMLCRKQYWESTGKRAKSKDWKDVFVVIQKGDLSMFIFGEHSSGGGTVVGGGNWLENASPVGTVQLAHSLAHALPPPGYNRQRPHCMVLTLANGGVYFFQAGTEELVNEWVSTCNYWAARQSKEPLAGGVSNMEYGWNRVLDPVTRTKSISDDDRTFDKSEAASIRSERSNRSRFKRKDIPASLRGDKSPWHDRIIINDWKPPMPPSVPSNHDEETQMEALQKHVAALKDDLVEHNELRLPMTQLYVPRSSNAAKALANWEKRSQYILTEIVKYESYIDSLQAAMNLRLKKRGEKALEKALGGAVELAGSSKARWNSPDAETIEEGEEPPPSARLDANSSRTNFTRR